MKNWLWRSAWGCVCWLSVAGFGAAQVPATGEVPDLNISSGSATCQASGALSVPNGFSVSGTGTAIFQAGTSIDILPGFDAKAGTSGIVFDAKVVSSITQALTINSQALPSGFAGEVYPGATLSGTGGCGPLTWSGTLPAGMKISGTGVISGTPTVSNPPAFTVYLKDAIGTIASKSFSITVGAALSITTTSLPSGVALSSYTAVAMAATGGTGAGYTWSATNVPAGMSLVSGSLSGTPTTPGTYTIPFTVTDSGGGAAKKSLSVTITSPPTTTSLTLTPTSTTYGNGVTLKVQVTPVPQGANETVTVVFDTMEEALPMSFLAAGFTFYPTKGTHHATATYNSDGVYSSSNSAQQTVTVTQGSPTINFTSPFTTSFAYGTTATLYISAGPGVVTGTVTIKDGSTALETVNLGSGGSATFSTSTLSVGTHYLTANYSGDANNGATNSAQLGITITPSVQLTDYLEPGCPTYCLAGDSFTVTVHGPPGGTVTVNGATAPPNSLTGTTSTNSAGVYQTSGTWSLANVATNITQVWSVNGQAAPTLQFNVYSSSQATVQLVDTTSEANYQAGQTTYSTGDFFTLTVFGQPGATVYYNGPSNPQGTLNSNGLYSVSDRWTSPGSFTQMWSVGTVPARPATLTFQVVGSPSLPTVTSAILPSGTAGASYTTTLVASGGAGGYQNWQVVSGSLPNTSFSLNSSTGVLAGTTSAPGTYSFYVTVQDSQGNISAQQQVTLVIGPGTASPQVLTASLGGGVLGVPYSITLQASGGSGSYSWSCSPLPPGFNCSSAGILSGTDPSATPWSGTVTITVSDLVYLTSGSANLSFNVSSGVFSLSSPSSGSWNCAGGSETITIGGTGSWLASSPPSWVVFTSSTSGTAPGSLTYSVSPNTSGSARSYIPISGVSFTINQTSGLPAPREYIRLGSTVLAMESNAGGCTTQ